MEPITISTITGHDAVHNDSALSPINVTDVSCNSQSTPIKNDASYTETPIQFKSTPIPLIVKPKVNFHSIADLIGSPSVRTAKAQDSMGSSGYASNNDSGIASHSGTPKGVDKENDKKLRTTFTDYQKQQLDIYFQHNPYPDPRETEELSQRLGLGEAVIKVWFQNKRSRDKTRKFSHKNRAAMRALENTGKGNTKQVSSLYSSPIYNNLQVLSSRINSYQNYMAVLQNQNVFRSNGSFY